MGVVALFLILSTISVVIGEVSEFQKQIDSGIRLTLHHVHRLPSATATDLLARDAARVEFINYRRSINSNSTEYNKSVQGGGGGGVSIGLKPGAAIGSGNYYVKMGLGTPVSYYDMIVDTGSSLTWLQCEPCQVYCHPQVSPIFNPSKSTTYKYVPCGAPQCTNLKMATLNAPVCSSSTHRCLYEASYGDQSYSIGYLSKDTLTLSSKSNPTLPDFVYGCGQDNEGLFGRSSGLIGLDRNSLSMSAQLSSSYGFMFSYCLPTVSSIGSLSIGRSSLYNYKGYAAPNSYVFTPMVTDSTNPSLYFLRWTGMTISGKPLAGVSLLKYRNTPTIIDSGTVISRIPVTIYQALRDAFVKAMSLKYTKAPAFSILDACYYMNRQKMPIGVPAVSMIFQGGAEMKLGWKNVVIEVENGVSCLAFIGTYATGGLAIIGNTQQQTFNVVYDVANSKVGFSAGGCD